MIRFKSFFVIAILTLICNYTQAQQQPILYTSNGIGTNAGASLDAFQNQIAQARAYVNMDPNMSALVVIDYDTVLKVPAKNGLPAISV